MVRLRLPGVLGFAVERLMASFAEPARLAVAGFFAGCFAVAFVRAFGGAALARAELFRLPIESAGLAAWLFPLNKSQSC